MTAKRLRQGVKDSTSMLWEKGEGSNKQPKYRLCSENRVREQKIAFERQRRGFQQTAKILLCSENRVREWKPPLKGKGEGSSSQNIVSGGTS